MLLLVLALLQVLLSLSTSLGHPGPPPPPPPPPPPTSSVPVPAVGETLWAPRFDQGRSLVTNEVAHRSPGAPGVTTSPDWDVTSGSLFSDGGRAWTGPVDDGSPDAGSTTATGSAVLRAVSRREDFGDVRVSFAVEVDGMTSTPRTGTNAWDGLHVFLRYASPGELYAVSACRRDGTVAIKRKTPGGAEAVEGGTYDTLAAAAGLPCPVGRPVDVAVDVLTRPEGTHLWLTVAGRTVLHALDPAGAGLPTATGRVGLRADNTELHVGGFRVSQLRAAGGR